MHNLPSHWIITTISFPCTLKKSPYYFIKLNYRSFRIKHEYGLFLDFMNSSIDVCRVTTIFNNKKRTYFSIRYILALSSAISIRIPTCPVNLACFGKNVKRESAPAKVEIILFRALEYHLKGSFIFMTTPSHFVSETRLTAILLVTWRFKHSLRRHFD